MCIKQFDDAVRKKLPAFFTPVKSEEQICLKKITN